MNGEVLEIGGVRHYLARSAAPTAAGVLLLPHYFGIDAFIRGFAARLAERGLTTLVWNPYPELPIGAEFAERPPRPNDEGAMRQMSGCLDVMERDLGLRSIATIGFCLGGRFALLFGARDARLRGIVACYPSIPVQRSTGQDLEPLPAAAAISAPVQLHYGGHDPVTTPATFAALQALLQGRSAETSIFCYPEAEHGFMHMPSPANDAATRSAMPHIDAFLDAYLRTT